MPRYLTRSAHRRVATIALKPVNTSASSIAGCLQTAACDIVSPHEVDLTPPTACVGS